MGQLVAESSFKSARAAIVATLLFTIICGIVFPGVLWLVAQLFPGSAHGSLVVLDGVPRGSLLIGQGFSAPRYFHPRPSHAGSGYDATSSGGSNLPPNDPRWQALAAERTAAYRAVNGLPANAAVPADAITGSGSGLDPRISPKNAALQTPRVARARGLAETEVAALVAAHTSGPALGILGAARVNVLELNLALDALSVSRALRRGAREKRP